MNNLKIYPLCSRPFQQTIGLAFNVEEIQPEYRARRRLEVPVHESRGRARSRRQDQNKTRGQDLPAVCVTAFRKAIGVNRGQTPPSIGTDRCRSRGQRYSRGGKTAVSPSPCSQ